MKADFLPLLKCPKTNEHLKLTVESNNQVEVLIGKVKSSKFEYPVEDGVVNFLDPDYAYIQQDMMHNISDVDVMKNKLGEAVFNNHPIVKVLQKLEDAYFANVPYNAVCIKAK